LFSASDPGKLVSPAPNKKPQQSWGSVMKSCGERGIRTPGPVTVNSFQDCRNRPLCHLSGAKVVLQLIQAKKMTENILFQRFTLEIKGRQ
jgi:hypothetical protein